MTSVQRPWENEDVQREGLRRSVKQLLDICKEEASIVGMENIILAGMSQGSAVIAWTLVMSDIKFRALIVLCGWMPFRRIVEKEVLDDKGPQHIIGLPVLLQHCRDDEVVPYANGEDLCEIFRNYSMDAKWKGFDEGGHWLNEPEGMDCIVFFLEDIMRNGSYFRKPALKLSGM